MKRILVTGGAGFIGSAIVNQMQDKGHELFVLDNLSFGKRAFVNVDDDHFFEQDILDKEKLDQTIQATQPHWFLHLAAVHFIPYCNQHPFESSRINLTGTENVLEATGKCESVEKVLFASTAAVYANSNHAIAEDYSTQPMDIYGLSKLMGERLMQKFWMERKIPTLICRFFNAFGPNETNPHLIPEIQKQLLDGKRKLQLGNLDPKRDFVHTFDMVNAIERLLLTDIGAIEVVNIGRGVEYSVREIVQSFERELGERLTIETDPKRVRKVERMHLLADVSKLKKLTGWEPQWEIDRGIRTLIAPENV